MFDWLLDILGFGRRGHGLDELSRRVGLSVAELKKFRPQYREFAIPKKSGGTRRIAAPIPELKALQRRILRRLLSRLKTHPAATGFQPGESFLTNARRHQGQAVVIHFDVRDFFPSIDAGRVRHYFRAVGWNRRAARLLVRLCTWENRLPQGAPTSPRLSNLVNYPLDARLKGLAEKNGAVYSRYADDITFSFAEDRPVTIRWFLSTAMAIVRDEGYQVHRHKKFDVRRQHQRQEVTGLVVNQRANLPRATRRWLRAVEHRTARYGKPSAASFSSQSWRPAKRPTISKEQLEGWRALHRMIQRQGD